MRSRRSLMFASSLGTRWELLSRSIGSCSPRWRPWGRFAAETVRKDAKAEKEFEEFREALRCRLLRQPRGRRLKLGWSCVIPPSFGGQFDGYAEFDALHPSKSIETQAPVGIPSAVSWPGRFSPPARDAAFAAAWTSPTREALLEWAGSARAFQGPAPEGLQTRRPRAPPRAPKRLQTGFCAHCRPKKPN